MTLQLTLDSLSSLARQHDADLSTIISLQKGGVLLTVYWTPQEDMPREATLVFGANGEDQDAFLFAFVVAPETWLHMVDEGLAPEEADDGARRMVESVGAVEAYLLGRSYEWVKPKPIEA